MNTNSPLLLTDDEAAEVLRILPARLRRLANAGAIPHVRLPFGDVRFDLAELERWIDQHRRPAQQQEGDAHE